MEHLKSWLVYIVIIAWVCTLADGFATYLWVKNGFAVEGNPLIASLMLWAGIGWAIVLRVIIGLVLLLFLFYFAEKGYKIAEYGIYGVTGALVMVVGYHSYGLWLLFS